MRIVLANRYYAPDVSATSQLVTDLAEHLAAQGHTVEVITSRQAYENPEADLPKRETINGVAVRRVWTTRFGRFKLWGRAVDYVSFFLSFFYNCLTELKKDNVLVCCTDPPMLSIAGHVACRLKRAQQLNWLQDVFPEVAVALDVVGERSPLTRLLTWLRNRSLRGACQNVVLGDVMAEKVRDCGVDPARISVIHNWSVAPPVVVPPSGEINPLRRAWHLEDKFVVGYSGNLGKVHEIDTLLHAAELLRDEADIHFLMIGHGYYSGDLERQALQKGLDNFSFQPYQPLEMLRYSLGVADVHLVILRPEMEGLIVPSKFYGAAASGRPVVFVGSEDGEVARILKREEAGFNVVSGDAQALADAVLQLRDYGDLRREMGANAARISEDFYTRENSLGLWSGLFRE